MEIDNVFKKYKDAKEQTVSMRMIPLDTTMINYLTLDEVATGLTQLSLPLVKQIVKNHYKNEGSSPVFGYKKIAIDILITESSVNQMLRQENQPMKLLET